MYYLWNKEDNYIVATNKLPKKNIDKYIIITKEEYDEIMAKIDEEYKEEEE